MPVTARLQFAILLLCLISAVGAAQSPSPSLGSYANCSFADGLQVVQTDMLPSQVSARPVETDTGTRRIDLESGMRIMFAYPDTDFFANVKAEILPGRNYPDLKQDLLDNFQHIAHGNIVNSSLASPLKGFEAHGLDREKLEGGVLGIYLLFDDSRRTVITIYFLNQQPESRKFQSLDEYRALRDHFLATYTSCIRSNQSHAGH